MYIEPDVQRFLNYSHHFSEVIQSLEFVSNDRDPSLPSYESAVGSATASCNQVDLPSYEDAVASKYTSPEAPASAASTASSQ